MPYVTLHNPDQHMIDLRQILAQGRKRIGILLGAGTACGIFVNEKLEIVNWEIGRPLIPAVAQLTVDVIGSLSKESKVIVDKINSEISKEINGDPNIEHLLSRCRTLASVLGDDTKFGLNGKGFYDLSENICKSIEKIVQQDLPVGRTPFAELAA